MFIGVPTPSVGHPRHQGGPACGNVNIVMEYVPRTLGQAIRELHVVRPQSPSSSDPDFFGSIVAFFVPLRQFFNPSQYFFWFIATFFCQCWCFFSLSKLPFFFPIFGEELLVCFPPDDVSFRNLHTNSPLFCGSNAQTKNSSKSIINVFFEPMHHSCLFPL